MTWRLDYVGGRVYIALDSHRALRVDEEVNGSYRWRYLHSDLCPFAVESHPDGYNHIRLGDRD